MIRLFLALAISSFIGFLPYVSTYPIYPSLPNTLYTVAGIMFSVGMSLVVTMSTQGIHNKEAKIEVQNKIQKLLMKYVLYFAFLRYCIFYCHLRKTMIYFHLYIFL